MRRRNCGIAVLLTVVDLMVKYWVCRAEEGHVFFRIEHIVQIVNYQNTGMAFSLFSGNAAVIGCATIILLLGIYVVMSKHFANDKRIELAVCCLMGGGLSNLFDRLVYQSVTDYIHVMFCSFPVFNIADMMITFSCFYLIKRLVTGTDTDSDKER